jgi:hypothetical protein
MAHAYCATPCRHRARTTRRAIAFNHHRPIGAVAQAGHGDATGGCRLRPGGRLAGQTPRRIAATRDLRLRVDYTGDVIRAYYGDKLLDEDFYNTIPFEIGLRRYGPAVYRDGIVLKILPLREDAPIYITDRGQLKFNEAHTALGLYAIDIIKTAK